ncbi:MAG: hypothetical protein ABW321_17410 [Polyangiales bacterium]
MDDAPAAAGPAGDDEAGAPASAEMGEEASAVAAAGSGGTIGAGVGGATGAAGEPALDADGGTAPRAGDGGAPSPNPGDAVERRPLIPYIAGSFTRVYVPNGERYLNDHSVVRGADALWHVIGITHTGPGAPQEERAFLHATAPALSGPWTDQLDALSAYAMYDERTLWAPHVVQTKPNEWTMLYTAQSLEPTPRYPDTRRAVSADLQQWTRADPSQGPAGGRDPYLFRDQDRWLVYSVGVRDNHGQIVVSSTGEREPTGGWSATHPIIEDPEPSFGWGNLESPTVLALEGFYYLFLTRTGEGSHTDYNLTLVFRSEDPERFDWQPIAELRAHAAEVVRDDETFYLTSCGWPSEIGERNRGLSIAKLAWAAQ